MSAEVETGVLFNSYAYIALLVMTWCGIRFLVPNRLVAHKILLLAASFAFYSFWDIRYLPILLTSILANYYLAHLICKQTNRKLFMIVGVLFNLSILGYFKYANFFLENIYGLWGGSFDNILQVALPLGISFFTFQQIAYLVDCYYQRVKHTCGFLTYGLFVSFFPQLIAGPIVHYSEMMPQFNSGQTTHRNYENIYKGICLFAIGLFKKSVIADTLAIYADTGFAMSEYLTFFSGWVCALCYTLQLYFDFSGYVDMARGSALLFNIQLPVNFNSPYKAVNIREFWKRWHVTLGRWLRNYIYIPLGGNRNGNIKTYANLGITFLLGGLWHGAGWTFILWGLMHGMALIAHRIGSEYLKISMPRVLAQLLTFVFVVIAWVMFRAENLEIAKNIYHAMFLFNGIEWPAGISAILTPQSWLHVTGADRALFPFLAIGLFTVFTLKNSQEIISELLPTRRSIFIYATFCVIGLMGLSRVSPFLYFQF